MKLAILILALAILSMGVCAFFFIFCRKYEEGIFGNLNLGFMILAVGVILVDMLGQSPSSIMASLPEPPWLLLILCSSLFMLRHAWRFVMFHWHGHFGWRPPKDTGLARQQ